MATLGGKEKVELMRLTAIVIAAQELARCIMAGYGNRAELGDLLCTQCQSWLKAHAGGDDAQDSP